MYVKWPLKLLGQENSLSSSRIRGVKVKQSLYRSGQTLKVPEGRTSQISRQSAHDSGKVVSRPTAFTPQEIFLVLISVRVWVEPRVIVPPEGLCQ